jgi:5-deoxy-glucuronate isomerase
MSLKVRKPLGPGLTRWVDGEMKRIRFSILKLKPGEGFSESLSDWELCLVLLCGECRVAVSGRDLGELGPRRDVFRDPAWAAYVPGGMSWQVEAKSELCAALCYAPGRGGEPRLIRPEDLVIRQRGRPGYERRVVDIAVEKVPAQSLLVGETFNAAGQWSSYPPHCHEKDDPGRESFQEEVYFYQVDPPQGFGYQRVYTDDRALDEAITVEHNDLVLLPRGYHPVAAAPGYCVYYLWVLAGTTRVMKPRDDPAHAWVLLGVRSSNEV